MTDILTNPLSLFKRLFTPCTYGEHIERYIASRNPQTPADVERLTQEYQKTQQGWML